MVKPDYTKVDYIKELKKVVEGWEHPLGAIADTLLNNAEFKIWPGSIDKHHAHMGGLAEHTWEVWNLSVDTLFRLGLTTQVDVVELYFAVLFHDAGKIYDYEQEFPLIWKKSNHCRNIHHISRSGLIWHDAVAPYPEIHAKYHDKVLHAILAHHGQRAWGSPVAPKSQVAWLVHLNDNLSARMNDWHLIDAAKSDFKPTNHLPEKM